MGVITLEYELETQFRCAGPEGFINWMDNTITQLGVESLIVEHPPNPPEATLNLNLLNLDLQRRSVSAA